MRVNTDYAACGCKILIVYCYLKFQCLYQAYQADPEAFTQRQLQFCVCGLGGDKVFQEDIQPQCFTSGFQVRSWSSPLPETHI